MRLPRPGRQCDGAAPVRRLPRVERFDLVVARRPGRQHLEIVERLVRTGVVLQRDLLRVRESHDVGVPIRRTTRRADAIVVDEALTELERRRSLDQDRPRLVANGPHRSSP